MSDSHGRRWIIGSVIGVLLLVVLTFTVWKAWQPEPWHADWEGPVGGEPTVSDADMMKPRITAFCGTCHAVPLPESFPRDAWHDMVLRGYEFYAQSGMTHLDPPPVEATVEYYRAHAPEEFVFPEVPDAAEPLRAKFTVVRRTSPEYNVVPPAIAHLRWARLDEDGEPTLLACDMRHGKVMAVDVNDESSVPRVLADLNNPCHVEPCDLDGDGAIDLVVADLGSFVPYDHEFGRVVWLRREERQSGYEEEVLLTGLGRVADVRPGDMDGDGDMDLVVADFGLHWSGSILWIQNESGSANNPRFVPHQIDPRPGTIHVPVVDLDDDGRLDFLALVSQEYECVEAFMNREGDVSIGTDAMFVRRRLWTGPDLTFGSSGIEPVDLDQDGDMDVLYTNGDAFDNNYVNPSHGIQWLENVGNEQFVYHRLADFIGVCRALAGDVDLDGDLDVVATAWLPEQIKPASLRGRDLPSIICLEQTEPGVFVQHTLERGAARYPGLELADFDGDGDLDFAVGTQRLTAGKPAHWLAVWWNRLR